MRQWFLLGFTVLLAVAITFEGPQTSARARAGILDWFFGVFSESRGEPAQIDLPRIPEDIHPASPDIAPLPELPPDPATPSFWEFFDAGEAMTCDENDVRIVREGEGSRCERCIGGAWAVEHPDVCGLAVPVCGNGRCTFPETHASCPVDCENPVRCGDGHCSESERVRGEGRCIADCGEGPRCGDKYCSKEERIVGEGRCVADCGLGPRCGDQYCSGEERSVRGEDRCIADCGQEPHCGNGTCERDLWETMRSCPKDCTLADMCGDGMCSRAVGEDCSVCAEDCCDTSTVCNDGDTRTSSKDGFPFCEECIGGAWAVSNCKNPVQCGDGHCSESERVRGEGRCVADCGQEPHCGNGTCERDLWETMRSCPKDCTLADMCGDGMCSRAVGEDCSVCPEDCAQGCVGEGECRDGDTRIEKNSGGYRWCELCEEGTWNTAAMDRCAAEESVSSPSCTEGDTRQFFDGAAQHCMFCFAGAWATVDCPEEIQSSVECAEGDVRPSGARCETCVSGFWTWTSCEEEIPISQELPSEPTPLPPESPWWLPSWLR